MTMRKLKRFGLALLIGIAEGFADFLRRVSIWFTAGFGLAWGIVSFIGLLRWVTL